MKSRILLCKIAKIKELTLSQIKNNIALHSYLKYTTQHCCLSFDAIHLFNFKLILRLSNGTSMIPTN